MEDAAARRERLKALKAAQQLIEGEQQQPAQQEQQPPEQQQQQQKQKQQTKKQQQPAAEAPPDKPLLKFRNYAVRDEKHIQHERLAPAQAPKLAEDLEVGTKPEDADEEELLASVAPKKANWDLKREIEPRLAKLERRTQRALMEIMLEQERERLQAEGGAAD